MGFNARAYLADRERLLEELVHGTRSSKWHKAVIVQHATLPAPDTRTEDEILYREDEYLRLKGVN